MHSSPALHITSMQHSLQKANWGSCSVPPLIGSNRGLIAQQSNATFYGMDNTIGSFFCTQLVWSTMRSSYVGNGISLVLCPCLWSPRCSWCVLEFAYQFYVVRGRRLLFNIHHQHMVHWCTKYALKEGLVPRTVRFRCLCVRPCSMCVRMYTFNFSYDLLGNVNSKNILQSCKVRYVPA